MISPVSIINAFWYIGRIELKARLGLFASGVFSSRRITFLSSPFCVSLPNDDLFFPSPANPPRAQSEALCYLLASVVFTEMIPSIDSHYICSSLFSVLFAFLQGPPGCWTLLPDSGGFFF